MRGLRWMLAGVLALMLAGCIDDNDPGQVSPAVYDVVQLVSTGATGSTFTLQHDDSPVVTLTAPNVQIDTERVGVGESLVLCYIDPVATTALDREVKALMYYPITNAKMVWLQPAQIVGWDDDPVWVESIWRSGSRINLRVLLPFDRTPRRLWLAAKSTERGASKPQLYLVHSRENDTPTFDRRYYISFDISEVWDNKDVEGIIINVANSNLNQREFEFVK